MSDDPRPLGGYAALMSIYATLVAALVWLLRGKRTRLVPFSTLELATYAVATEHLSRLVTKDSVMSWVRAPFTEFQERAGEGEVNEEAVGDGLRHAAGELISCPFCAAQWVATGLVAGRVALPRFTTAVVSVAAIARASDFLQLLYGMARNGQG